MQPFSLSSGSSLPFSTLKVTHIITRDYKKRSWHHSYTSRCSHYSRLIFWRLRSCPSIFLATVWCFDSTRHLAIWQLMIGCTPIAIWQYHVCICICTALRLFLDSPVLIIGVAKRENIANRNLRLCAPIEKKMSEASVIVMRVRWVLSRLFFLLCFPLPERSWYWFVL